MQQDKNGNVYFQGRFLYFMEFPSDTTKKDVIIFVDRSLACISTREKRDLFHAFWWKKAIRLSVLCLIIIYTLKSLTQSKLQSPFGPKSQAHTTFLSVWYFGNFGTDTQVWSSDCCHSTNDCSPLNTLYLPEYVYFFQRWGSVTTEKSDEHVSQHTIK